MAKFESLSVFFLTLLLSASSVYGGSAPKYGPNGGVRKAFPSVFHPGSFYAFGYFDNWNSTPIPLKFARILNNGEVDTSFAWSAPAVDEISEDSETQKIWYCRAGNSADDKTVLLVGSTSPNGGSSSKELEVKIPYTYKCSAIHATSAGILVSAGDLVFFIDKQLKSATQLKLNLNFDKAVNFISSPGDRSDSSVFVEYATTDSNNQWITKLSRLGPSGVVDPTFKIESGFNDLAVVSNFDSKMHIYYGGSIYDSGGKELARLDATNLNTSKSKCKSLGSAVLSPSGRSVILSVLGGLDRDNCQKVALGFSEVSLEDGHLVKEVFQSVLASRPLNSVSYLAPFDISKGIFGIFNSDSFYRPTFPVFSVVYPDGFDSAWKVSEGVWDPLTGANLLPSTADGKIPASFFLYAHGYGTTMATGLPHFSVSSSGQVVGDPGLNLDPIDWTLSDRAPLPFLMENKTWLWFGGRKTYVSGDGRSLQEVAALSGMPVTPPFFNIQGQVNPFYFLGDSQRYLTQIDFLKGLQKRQYSGLTGDITQVFPFGPNSVLIWGNLNQCPEGPCTYNSSMQLVKFDFSKNSMSSDFQSWGHPVDGGDGPYSGYRISAMAGDPSQSGTFIIAGVHYGPPVKGNKVFLGRIRSDGSQDPNFWVEGLMERAPTAVLALKDGRVFVGGPIIQYGNDKVKNIFLVDSTGKLDSSFNLIQGPTLNPGLRYYSPEITGLYSIGDGDVLILGKFSTMGSVTTQNVARVNLKGEIQSLFSE